MKVTHRTSALMVFTLVAVGASFGQQVNADYDRSIDFSRYKTYHWEKVQTEDQLWTERIKAAVNSSLSAKGWTQVESGGDVCIVAMDMNQTHQTLNTYYDNFGPGWGWRGWGGGGIGDFGEATTREQSYLVGTLVVDMFDSQTKRLIWRGSASGTLSDKSGRNIKNLNKGVEKMFEHFPPEPRKAER